MATALAKQQSQSAVLEQVVIHGDLSKLSPQDRVFYYKHVCESVGLNPLTKPLAYLSLNGKLVLYALRDATDQLRKINGVSIVILSREVVEDCYVVTAKATDKTGRTDESIGAVPVASLKGEARANALMKAETKAKRRVTLSICGMGWLDETEVDSIPGARVVPDPDAPPVAPDDRMTVSAEQINAIKAALEKSTYTLPTFLNKFGLEDLTEIAAVDAPRAVEWLRKRPKTQPSVTGNHAEGDLDSAMPPRAAA